MRWFATAFAAFGILITCGLAGGACLIWGGWQALTGNWVAATAALIGLALVLATGLTLMERLPD